MAKKSSETKRTFATTQKECAEIMASLAKGHYAPVYFLYGEEGYFVDKIENYITSHCIGESERDFNQTIIYGKDSNGGDVVAAARRYPVMSSRQLVVVREAQSLKGIDEVASYIENPSISTVLVLVYRSAKVDKRTTFYKKISSYDGGVVFESIPPRDYEVGRFVEALLKEKRVDVEPRVISIIADSIGANLNRIESEIDKLLTRLSGVRLGDDQSRIITAQDVEDNIGISKKFNNYEFCKSLSYLNFDKALNIAEHLSANEKDTPLISTIGAMFRHFKSFATLAFINYEVRMGRRVAPSQSELSRELGLPSPYFLEEYLTASNHYTIPRCVAILGLIREWDMKSKGMGSGSVENSELLRDLVLRIANI